MSSHIDDLERLQRLRDAGVLSEEEFAVEKRRILGGEAAAPPVAAEPEAAPDPEDREQRSRTRVILLLALVGIAVAIGIGLLIGRVVAPERHAEPPSNGIAANMAEPALDAGPPAAPDVQTLPPAEQLDKAFQAAFGKSGSVVVALDSGRDYGTDSFSENVEFTPAALVPASFGPVLVSVGEVKDAAHVSAGKLAVHYLRPVGDRFAVVRSFVPAVVAGSFGRIGGWHLSSRFSDYPVLDTAGGGTWQGYSCTTATLTELAPAGPRTLATIPLAYDDSGAVGEGGQATDISGKIANVVKGQSFDVVYSGSQSFVDHYVRSGNGYTVEGGQTRMQTC